MSEFKREERYIVVKLRRISDETEEALREFLISWHIPTEQCVVVEHDWPNYEDTWEAIEKVAAGAYGNEIPDAYAVIEQDGKIGYTVMVQQEGLSEDQGDWVARRHCNEHINECCSNGVEGAGEWVIRPLTIGGKK